MSALDSRFRGPHERVPVMHQLGTHPMPDWGGLLRTPRPPSRPLPPPLPPGPPPLSVQMSHPILYRQVEYQMQTPPPPPPVIHALAHPTNTAVPHPTTPQPPIQHLPVPVPVPTLSHPSVFQLCLLPNPPMALNLLPIQHQLLNLPVHPPLPLTPYPHSSSQPSRSAPMHYTPFVAPSHQPLKLSASEPQPPGLDISPASLKEQFLSKPESQSSPLRKSPHRCFTEIPKIDRIEPEETKVATKTVSTSIIPPTFSCSILDDSDDEQDIKPSTYLFIPGSIDYSYKPPPVKDPFANSKSLRHQQPSNPRRRRDDDEEADNDEDDSELEDETDEDFMVRVDRTYQELFPKVRKFMNQMGVDENWQLDKEEKACMICPFPQRLKGWTALLQHADKFKKRRLVQHRAYYRALSDHLKRGPRLIDDQRSEEKAVLIDSGKLAEELIVWPPLVIITNMKDKESLDIHVPLFKTMDVEKTLRENTDGKPGRMLVMFPASELGLLNAKLLVESLAKLLSSQMPTNVHISAPRYNTRAAMGGVGPFSVQHPHLYSWPMDPGVPVGHLAEPSDMINIDPHKKLINWSAENRREILKIVSKKSKEEHEREKAKLKAKLVEVDQIAESHQRFKSSKALLSLQLKEAEMGLQEQKQREEYISYRHAEQLKLMDAQFKSDIWRMEEERLAREGKIRALFESNERQLLKERIERNKEVETMRSQVANITQELEKHIAQKALGKEREIARRREEAYAVIKQREEQFNEVAHNMERNMLEKHEAQKMKLVEDFNKMRQEILMEWLRKQTALKASAESAKQEKEKLESEAKILSTSTETLSECSVCFLDFGEEATRALMQPCGHAKICLKCAVDIYQKTRLCPICRVRLSTKPKAIPKLYM
ncbi:hypothetical protein MPTK1_7g13470 [Marchantia polymorpha subsp. ruderalis]|uniref:RING-type domain-containing protein n=2 Tax=Marchantia polymorpha TaxID=3197 RepID=A0AAF6BZ67_MARPO|nr:hypothetical protein MARPO_0009s0033 [Marchantia polymorpha]BBN17300.1 hypothetical protein Mp_7g13470 [Marchantia polymorpha subsp. ruderalis]PTQ46906.1 hypothetical protein MARPO_0009s0033 [Marchantia polymorpha]PTQ46907.1 hypothetical protein MARPO_0009s0033 [Marchantia polymorpha]BBN17301.1 hypothetical protein Mp_7g13470 [Marchantia polymorpha subsp. ruderalis]|eukprot:PTQ46905.1 hypothetical protein MARPO_0009s0033 [Marchantia polymorpha]